MFHNRILAFDMNPENQQGADVSRALREERSIPMLLAPVRTCDIYQAAANRALQDYELDKLFNPGYYDFQI